VFEKLLRMLLIWSVMRFHL